MSRIYLIAYVMFILITTSTCTKKGKHRTKDSSSSLNRDFLNTAAFRKTILSIVQQQKEGDIRCKIGKGHFSYMSYTGRCENCSLHCSNPTDGMMTQCFNKCEDYMLNQLSQRGLTEAEVDIQILGKNLASTTEEIDDLKRCVTLALYGFVIASFVILVAVIAAFLWFKRHIKQNYASRHPIGPPRGDVEMEEIKAVQPEDENVD